MESRGSWLSAAFSPLVRNNEVHVWRAWLDLSPNEFDRLHRTLAPDELSRAARLRLPEDQKRFVAGRAILRDILARYLKTKGSELRFCYREFGKPDLESEPGAGKLAFNLSHSHGIALYAITRGRDIGIDVEQILPELADHDTARLFFSPREIATLCGLPVNCRAEAFFECWTRREAYVKARGEGFATGLNGFDVSLGPNQPAAVLRVGEDPLEASQWSLHALAPAPDYVGAVAVKGNDLLLRLWHWKPLSNLIA